MGKKAICDKCKQLYDYIPETKFEGGMSYSSVKCPHCGYVKSVSTSYVHYGNDAIKK